MTFDKMVKDTKRKFYALSIQEVRTEIDKKWVQEKIANYHERTGIDTSQIKHSIMTNDIVASTFCRNPVKCNIAERLACDILGIELLPQSGAKAIRFNEQGEITSQKDVSVSKAVDCELNGRFFALKYTEGKGGGQDNQAQDIYVFLRNGSMSNKVGAILDGEYWKKRQRN